MVGVITIELYMFKPVITPLLNNINYQLPSKLPLHENTYVLCDGELSEFVNP